jgi:hypothetical protein
VSEERLLAVLRQHANPRGIALVAEDILIRESRLSRAAIAPMLMKLDRAGLVEVLSPLPFLVARLRGSWSGNSPSRVREQQQISSSSVSVHREVPISSSNRAAAATQQSEDGGAGEGEQLLDQVLAVLGPEADRDEFRAILAGHHPALIHRCLRRVESTKTFRVSRAALFRSLLLKLSR